MFADPDAVATCAAAVTPVVTVALFAEPVAVAADGPGETLTAALFAVPEPEAFPAAALVCWAVLIVASYAVPMASIGPSEIRLRLMLPPVASKYAVPVAVATSAGTFVAAVTVGGGDVGTCGRGQGPICAGHRCSGIDGLTAAPPPVEVLSANMTPDHSDDPTATVKVRVPVDPDADSCSWPLVAQ